MTTKKELRDVIKENKLDTADIVDVLFDTLDQETLAELLKNFKN